MEQQIRNAEEEMEVAAGEAGDEVREDSRKTGRRVRGTRSAGGESPQQGGKEEDGQREVEV